MAARRRWAIEGLGVEEEIIGDESAFPGRIGYRGSNCDSLEIIIFRRINDLCETDQA